MSDKKKPLWVKCKKCEHCWAGAYYPLNPKTMATLAKHARCPMCGTGNPWLAKQNNGKLNEPLSNPHEAKR